MLATEGRAHDTAGRVEGHLRSCEACQAWRACDERLSVLLGAVADEELPLGFREHVMAEVRVMDELRKGRQVATVAPWWRRPSFLVQGLFAAAALAVLLSPFGTGAVAGV